MKMGPVEYVHSFYIKRSGTLIDVSAFNSFSWKKQS